MNFLIDAQLPRRLAVWLAAQGHDALHTLDLPSGNAATDRALAALAKAQNRVMVTKDADFVQMYFVEGSPQRLLLVSTGNISNELLLAVLQRHLPRIEQAFKGHRFVELQRTLLVTHE